MSVSAVVPIHNELQNIRHVYAALQSVFTESRENYELIFVDDGSTDGSTRELYLLASTDPRVKVIELRRNYGQSAAIDAGLRAASGDAVVTMDGDCQNDPADIPMMLAKLAEGYDLVHGWRRERHDGLLTRRIPSRVANWLISRMTRFPVHDLGCTLKAMRREIADELHLYGEMHRFIPILARWRGARCLEVVVSHHPRRFGTSKYGLSRTIRVVLDLITVKYMTQYLVTPMKLFGGLGLSSGFLGGALFLGTLWMKLAGGVDMTGNPLLLLTVFLMLAGIQLFILGMLGELATRIYFESQDERPYAVRKTANFYDHDSQNRRQVITSMQEFQHRRAA